MVDYRENIVINPAIRFGKPCIKGTRISVADVMGWLASEMTFEEIIDDFPQIKKEDIIACLAYCADKERKIRVIA